MTAPTLPSPVDAPVPPGPPRRPARKAPRVRYIVLGIVCVGAVVALLFGALARNVVYFRTVTEAVERRPSEGTHRLRVAGEVVPGSVEETDTGVVFELTDGKTTIRVLHRGDPPQLFADGVPIVSEGRWGEDDAFASDRILIRHGSEYKPPSVDSDKAPAPSKP